MGGQLWEQMEDQGTGKVRRIQEEDQETVDKGLNNHLSEIEATEREDRFGCGKLSKVSVFVLMEIG